MNPRTKQYQNLIKNQGTDIKLKWTFSSCRNPSHTKGNSASNVMNLGEKSIGENGERRETQSGEETSMILFRRQETTCWHLSI